MNMLNPALPTDMPKVIENTGKHEEWGNTHPDSSGLSSPVVDPEGD